MQSMVESGEPPSLSSEQSEIVNIHFGLKNFNAFEIL